MQDAVPRAAIEKLYSYPFVDCLSRRRSRRFGLGFEIEAGPLKYISTHEPIPLTAAETAILCFAGAGDTGLALGDAPVDRGGNDQVSCTGRTFPSACNNQRTQLLFTNDDGTYIYKPGKPSKPVEIETVDDLIQRVFNFDEDITKLSDGRMEIPSGPPALLRANESTVNRQGQTLFMPIVDTSYELICLFLLLIQYERYLIIDAETGKPAGIDKWIDKLQLKVKAPLQTLEPNVLAVCAMEGASISQNILMMAQAMGLGAFPFGGFTSIVVMGGTPICKGLGFHFSTDKKGVPRPIGINGILEGHCPPYQNMDSAVDAVVQDRFGMGQVFSEECTPSPLRDQKSFARGVEKIPAEVVQCVKDLCNYIYDRYGAFPASVNTMNTLSWTAVHHSDLDFYDKYYRSELISDNMRAHMKEWH